jgi:hypothetical protein
MHFAEVDEEDLDLLAQHSWRLKGKAPNLYAQASINGHEVLMHRLILNAQSGRVVDHRNHNGLDNRRENIRLCSQQQNQFNRRKAAKTRSGLKGVVYMQPVGRRGNTTPWRAQATLNGRTVSLGRYATPEAAHAVYRHFIETHHGQFACPQ